jgi:DNA-binding beta-propeller fold protein YncE
MCHAFMWFLRTRAVVTTLAGGLSGTNAAYADGAGTLVGFNGPTGVAVDMRGNVYVADSANRRVRQVSPVGMVTTLAGTGVADAYSDGIGTQADFNNPFHLTMDLNGTLYVADAGNQRIRTITIAMGMLCLESGGG